MDKNNKDKWINDTIESINGIKRAEASPFLYAKVLNKIKSGNRGSGIIPVRKVALGFLTMLLLAALNIAVTLNSNSNNTESGSNNNVSEELVPSQSNPYLEYLK